MKNKFTKIRLIGLLIVSLTTVNATTFTVNYHLGDLSDPVPEDGVCETTLGNGQCSLRAAIESADKTPDGPHIVEVPYLANDSYPLSGEEGLRIEAEVTIRGTGNGKAVITGNMTAATSLLLISGPLFVEAQPSVIENLEFRPNSESVHGITVFGSKTNINLNQVTIIPSLYAAGLYVTSGENTLTVCNRCLIKNGQSNGIRVRNNSALSLLNSRITGNVSSENGAGLLVETAKATIQNSLIDNNFATGESPNFSGSGGGIYSSGTESEVHIINSTISGNKANADGGGIFSNQTDFLLENVTITENFADFDDAASAGEGGGIYMTDFTAITAKNSIIHGNFLPCPINDPLCFRDGRNCTDSAPDINIGILSLGWVMTGNDSFCPVTDLTLQPNYTSSDAPNLDPLTQLGGFHPVHPITTVGDEADGGDPDGCSYQVTVDNITQGIDLLIDQRGMQRPFDSDPDPLDGHSCDIGAYEAKCFGDDPDEDYVGSQCDVCPDVFDPLQQDSNNDGIGDACSDDLIFYDGFE